MLYCHEVMEDWDMSESDGQFLCPEQVEAMIYFVQTLGLDGLEDMLHLLPPQVLAGAEAPMAEPSVLPSDEDVGFSDYYCYPSGMTGTAVPTTPVGLVEEHLRASTLQLPCNRFGTALQHARPHQEDEYPAPVRVVDLRLRNPGRRGPRRVRPGREGAGAAAQRPVRLQQEDRAQLVAAAAAQGGGDRGEGLGQQAHRGVLLRRGEDQGGGADREGVCGEEPEAVAPWDGQEHPGGGHLREAGEGPDPVPVGHPPVGQPPVGRLIRLRDDGRPGGDDAAGLPPLPHVGGEPGRGGCGHVLAAPALLQPGPGLRHAAGVGQLPAHVPGRREDAGGEPPGGGLPQLHQDGDDAAADPAHLPLPLHAEDAGWGHGQDRRAGPDGRAALRPLHRGAQGLQQLAQVREPGEEVHQRLPLDGLQGPRRRHPQLQPQGRHRVRHVRRDVPPRPLAVPVA
eukprot:766212-Hanusia_phi.AAC.1